MLIMCLVMEILKYSNAEGSCVLAITFEGVFGKILIFMRNTVLYIFSVRSAYLPLTL